MSESPGQFASTDREPIGAAVELAPGVRVSPNGIRLQFSRGSGPGGQNVNKVNTKAEIWIHISDLTGLTQGALERLKTLAGRRFTDAQELHLISEVHRTQSANRAEVFERLRELLIEAGHEPRKRRKTKPSKASKRRRLESKKHRSEIKSKRGGRDIQ